ncbi:MAG: class I SAM-dependent methyltransferase [Peptococcaceae bacterium]|jgi:SAM-dependent methyltransferase|nr:class I SAM-dependent methyltransferase [Peptococcaceae bacterium]
MSSYNTTAELARFQSLWEERSLTPPSHSQEAWDKHSRDWVSELGPDGKGKRSMTERVRATAGYLRGRGLLGRNDTVVDVGCGPGLFAAEFAKTAKHATGMDYAQAFIDYGTNYAKSNGIKNVSYTRCDFLELDIESAGLTGAFDLVFSSITPAATGKGCLGKLIQMSRAYCCNVSFVHAQDDLASQVSREVFGHEKPPKKDGKGFYALLNLLWFMGYYPETYYYTDLRHETSEPTEKSVANIAHACDHESEEDIRRIADYLRSRGPITERNSEYRFGFILWDTRVRHTR